VRTTLIAALILVILIGLGTLFVLERGGGVLDLTALRAAAAPGAAGAGATSKGKMTSGVPDEPKAVAYDPERVAADGVVEGARPEVAIRPDVPGMLAAVHVREGQDVPRDTLLAELENQVQKQQVGLAVAERSRARAQLERVRNGERAERRRAVAAGAQAKEVIFQQSKSDYERSRKLVESKSASREELDRAFFAMQKAHAEWDVAVAEYAEVEAPARPDDIAIQEGNVAAAEARLRLAEAELAKTRLLAPCDGRILQVFAEPGEQAGPNTPQPVLLLADLSKRRVRAFVEELDAARVAPGQRAEVTADGLPGRVFHGTVGLVMPRMGQRGPQSDAPGEYKDLYYREALIDLDAGDELPINFRVQVRIYAGSSHPGDAPTPPAAKEEAGTKPPT
jgi:multidrug resistance efflux pump